MYYIKNLLNKYININEEDKIMGDILTLKTCEIEEVIERKIPELVVIGKCTKVEKHPEADKLVVCQIDCGPKGNFQIITGGDNITEGHYVPAALPGCYLSTIDLKIGARPMRGVDSNGMICSKGELGINEDEDKHWIWLLDEDLELTDADLGMSLGDKFPWLNNSIFDVDNKTLTNRPENTGHFGIANELYTIYNLLDNKKISFDKISEYRKLFTEHNILEVLENANKIDTKVICETDLLRAYSIVELNNVEVKRSSFYTRTMLIDLGLEPRNNWVDFSNLFMVLSGNPVHFFDKDKVKGNITIRNAKEGETFEDLFDTVHDLKTTDLVITDDEKILALAGVVGGKNSGIDDSTKNILVEIANFDNVAVRKTGTRLGLRTDAELRFEKNPNPAFTLHVVNLFLDELKYFSKDLGNFEIKGLDYYKSDSVNLNKTLEINYSKLQNFIFGKQVEGFNKICDGILTDLGFRMTDKGENKLLTIPAWRSEDDVNNPEDIYEEISRIYGYENIDQVEIETPIHNVQQCLDVRLTRAAESTIVDKLQYKQVETYPWVEDELLDLFETDKSSLFSLINATAPNLTHLRDSLVYNILKVVEKNFRFADNIKVFDIGKVWKLDENINKENKENNFTNEISNEKNNIVLARYAKAEKNWKDSTILQLKGDVEIILNDLGVKGKLDFKPTEEKIAHPKQQAEIRLNNKKIGIIHSLHPFYYDNFKFPQNAKICYAEIYLEEIKAIFEQQNQKTSIKLSSYQTLQDQIVFRDINFVVDKTKNFGDVIIALKKVKEIDDIEVFDIYAGSNLPEGKKSIAVKLKIVGDGKYTNDDINGVMDKAIAQASKAGAELRQ